MQKPNQRISSDLEFTSPDGGKLKNVRSLEIVNEAAQPSYAVPKHQVESIAEAAAGSKVNDETTSQSSAMSSQKATSLLQGKQDSLTVHPDSIGLIEIVDSNQLKISSLTTKDQYFDLTHPTLELALANATYTGDGSWIFGPTIEVNGELEPNIEAGGKVLESGDLLYLKAGSAGKTTWVHNGGFAGDVNDWIDIDPSLDRNAVLDWLSASGALRYNAQAGTYSIEYGLESNQLGSHVLPVNPNDLVGLNKPDAVKLDLLLKEIWTSIQSKFNTQTESITTHSEYTTSRMGISKEQNFCETTQKIKSSESINTVFLDIDDILRNLIQQLSTETQNRNQGDQSLNETIQNLNTTLSEQITNEQTARVQSNNVLAGSINSNSQEISSEKTRAISEETLIRDRLDTVEGDDTTPGSISSGIKSSKDYTDQEVSKERQSRQAEVSRLDSKLDYLQSGDIRFIGIIKSTGVVEIRNDEIANGDTRNGKHFKDITINPGDTFIADVDVVITFNDNTTLTLAANDDVMALSSVLDEVGRVTTKSDFRVGSDRSTDITKANIDYSPTATVHLNGEGHLEVPESSLDSAKFTEEHQNFLASLTSNTSPNQITRHGDTWNVIIDTADDNTTQVVGKNVTFNTPVTSPGKQTVVGTSVSFNTSGSGTNGMPAAASGEDLTITYNGECVDESLILYGSKKAITITNVDASILSAVADYSIDAGGSASQIVAVSGWAQNSAKQNISAYFGAKHSLLGKDVALYTTLTTLDKDTHAFWLAMNPVRDDAAHIIDMRLDPQGKAIVAYKGHIDLTDAYLVEVPSAFDEVSSDKSPITKGDLKAKEQIYLTTLPDSGTKDITINHLDLSKVELPLHVESIEDGKNIMCTLTKVDSSTIRIEADLPLGAAGRKVKLFLREWSCDIVDLDI